MITLPAQTLAAALKSAAQIVETKNTLPLLGMVKFDGTTITTSNLDIQYTATLDATGELAACVDAKRLAAWASAASGSVTLTLSGHILTAKAGRSRMALPALPIDDFPMMPVDGLGKAMAITFGEVTKRTLWAASTAPSQAYLSGVFMCSEQGKARFVATDGYKMPIVTTTAKWPKGAPDVILPPELAKVLAEAGPGSLEWSDRLCRFTAGAVTITGKMLDGKFIDHRSQLTKVAGEPYAVDAGELVDAVRRVRIASDAQQRRLRLTRRNGALGVRIEGTSGAEGDDEIDADCTEGFEAGFNADFLVGMLQAADTDAVSIEQDAPGTMMRISPVAQGADMRFEGLLWPLRI